MKIIEFNNYIDESQLVDVPMIGNKFTWFSLQGNAKSRLDRFLLSDGILNNWGVDNQKVLQRDIFDHCPIVLSANNINWGPKPFKVNNCWFEHKEFLPFGEKS